MVTITINGRLSKDPETKELNGFRVTQFTVAARTTKKDAEGNPLTNFYRVSAFNTLGDTIAKHFHQGDGIVVTGALSVREYVSTNGEKRYSLDVDMRDFDFGIGKKQTAEGEEAPAPAPAQTARPKAPTPHQPQAAAYAEDDLPF